MDQTSEEQLVWLKPGQMIKGPRARELCLNRFGSVKIITPKAYCVFRGSINKVEIWCVLVCAETMERSKIPKICLIQRQWKEITRDQDRKEIRKRKGNKASPIHWNIERNRP
jgi:hypothetical protein